MVTRHTAYPPLKALVASKTPVWRSRLLLGILAAGFLVVIGRAAWVQVWDSSFYQEHGEARYARTLILPADRGKVYDRNGELLASSVALPSFWINPDGVEHNPKKQKQLAQLLSVPLSKLQQKWNTPNKHFVWLKRHVNVKTAKHIESLGMKGIGHVTEYHRDYPHSEFMAQILGLTSDDGQGLEGVERFYNAQLQGRPGARRVYKANRLGKNSPGAVVEQLEEILPTAGQDIALSIDSRIQFFTYQELKAAVLDNHAKSGSVVVLDTHTGEILALANYPSYDPSKRQNLRPENLRNRALADEFEPGSTMKPFVVALALAQKRVKPETILPTASGHIKVDGIVISDTHVTEDLSVAQAIQKSSNVGVVKMVLGLPSRDLWVFYRALGFGQKPSLDFPGVATGHLRHYQDWRRIEKATMAYGYGISSSLLQLAQAYTVFANDGIRIPVTLLKRDPNKAISGTRIVAPEVAQQIRTMLHAVTLPGGTAQKAQPVGYSVGGKTGTVHKLEGRQYAKNKYRSLFVGLAPIERPRIAIAVIVNEPSNGKYYGGDVAAPIFSATAQATLHLLGVAPVLSEPSQIAGLGITEELL